MARKYHFIGGVLGILLLSGSAMDPISAVAQNPKIMLPTPVRAEDLFGFPVVVSGSIMAVGSMGVDGISQNEGKVYVFYKDGSGEWIVQKEIVHPIPATNQSFGTSLSLDGSDLLIGSYGPNSSGGKSFLFSKDQGGTDAWGLVKQFDIDAAYSELKIKNGIAVVGNKVHYQNFGGTNAWGEVATLTTLPQKGIDIDGDFIFIGNQGPDNLTGVVSVYNRDQGGVDKWGLLTSLQPAGIPEGSRFGLSLSAVNNLLVVSAYDENHGSSPNGALYFYKKDQGGVNNWGLVQRIEGPDTFYSNWFGLSLQLEGDRLYALKKNNSSQEPYAIHVFTLDAGQNQWVFQNEVTMSNTSNAGGRPSLFFVDSNHDIYFSDHGSSAHGLQAGRALKFTENVAAPFTWSLDQEIFPVDAITGSSGWGYGSSTATDGDWAAVTSYGPGSGGFSVYMFNRYSGGDDFWGSTQRISNLPHVTDIDLIGDYLVIGAFGSNSYGEVFIYKRNGLLWSLAKTIEGIDHVPLNGGFGYNIHFDGTVLTVSDGVGVNSIYIFYKDLGGVDNFGFVKKITSSDGQSGDEFASNGMAVQGNTLIATAPYDDVSGMENAGSVYIFQKDIGGVDNWGFLKKISGTTGFYGLGNALSFKGDYCWVSNTNDGRSFLFGRDQGGANNWGKIMDFNFPNYCESGEIEGNYIIMGLSGRDGAGRGTVTVVHKDQGGTDAWGLVYQYQTSLQGDWFGWSSSSNSSRFIVGAPKSAPGDYTGQAYLFYLPPVTPIPTPSDVTEDSFVVSWNVPDMAESYEIDFSTSPDFSNFLPGYDGLITTQNNLTVDNNLSGGQTYYLRIRSLNSVGESPYSNTVAILTSPLAPVANDASDVSASGFTASWQPVATATKYFLDLSKDNFATIEAEFNGKEIAGTSAVITGLEAGTLYGYRVRAFNGSSSVSSNKVFQTTLPAAPVALAVNPDGISVTSFRAAWTPAQSATSYELEVTKNDFIDLIAGYNPKVVTNATDEIVTGLTPQTAYKFRLRARSPEGYSGYSNTISVQTNEAPGDPLQINTSATSSTAETGFATLKITVQVSGGVPPYTITMRHRPVTGGDFEPVNATLISGNEYEAVVEESYLDEIGMEYFFEVTDQVNNEISQAEHSFIYRAITLTSPATSIPFASNFSGKSTSYQMFSIPYDLDDKSFAGIFNELGAYDKTKWRLFHFDGLSQRYHEYQAGLSNNIELGRGYWFNADSELAEAIQVGAGEVTGANQEHPFSYNFSPGWNQIGNPYPFGLDWIAIQSANPAAGLNSLFFYESGGYVRKSVLPPWKGAFVYSDNGGTVTFPVLSKTASSGRTTDSELPIALDEDNWQLPITLTFNDLVQTSAIGMHLEAERSKDRYDEIAVPHFINYLDMYTLHPEFKAHEFSTDMVATSDKDAWIFTLSSNKTGGQAKLTWNQDQLAGSKSQLILIDLTDQVWVDMKTTSLYVFKWKEGRQVKIFYSREGEISPGITFLGNAYPNPFTKEVNIPVVVAGPNEAVQVEIFDLVGRKIATLSKNFPSGGLQTLTWTAADGQGNEFGHGLFLYRIRGMNQIKRMIKK